MSPTNKSDKRSSASLLSGEDGYFLLAVLVAVLIAVLAITGAIPGVSLTLEKKNASDETRLKLLFLTESLIRYYKNMGEFPPYDQARIAVGADLIYVRSDDLVEQLSRDLGKDDIGSAFDKGDYPLKTLFTDYPLKQNDDGSSAGGQSFYYDSKSRMQPFAEIYQKSVGRPPHVLDALAVNPYESSLTPEKFTAWRNSGPFAASGYIPGSYRYDGFHQDIKYIYPFPYDETGYFDYYRNNCVAEPRNLKCNRVLLYSVGADMPFLIDPGQNKDILENYCLIEKYGMDTAELETPLSGSCDIPTGCPNRPVNCNK